MAKKTQEHEELMQDIIVLLAANANRLTAEIVDEDRTLTLDETRILQLSAKTIIEASEYAEAVAKRKAESLNIEELLAKVRAGDVKPALASVPK